MTPAKRHLVVVGAGWAGLAGAVRAVQAGWQVTLLEMAPQAGGRARSTAVGGLQRDNGQHILIGAYRQTLALMRSVGADPQQLLLRLPLTLRYPDGHGLQLPPGAPLPAFVRGVLAARGWGCADRLALLASAGGWLLRGFACPADWTVARLCRRLPAAVRRDLVEPLCVAALNTPMAEASAAVFLTVLRDALFSGSGSADLLLPRQPLAALLPSPALAWLVQHGAQIQLAHRAGQLSRTPSGWQVDGWAADAVLLACPPQEAARLAEACAPAWAAAAQALRYEPIVTAYLHDGGPALAQPLLALRDGPEAPAQFALDLGALGLPGGGVALVASGAGTWVARGLPATGQALLQQAQRTWPGRFLSPAALVHLTAERRATFACTPGLQRPGLALAPGLVAAGDYIAGPYPATLEGAVRAGEAAVAHLGAGMA